MGMTAVSPRVLALQLILDSPNCFLFGVCRPPPLPHASQAEAVLTVSCISLHVCMSRNGNWEEIEYSLGQLSIFRRYRKQLNVDDTNSLYLAILHPQ